MKLLFVLCLISLSLATALDEEPAQDFSMPQYIAAHAPTETKPQKAARLWAKMEGHIFNGEPRNPDAGRHILSAWCATHKGASGTCNTESRLCLFGFGKNKIKTVWNDGVGGYSRGDIATLCKASILHNLDQSRLADRAFMIQTHLKRPICVTHQVSGDGSCFPDGINFRRDKQNTPGGSVKIGDQCPRGGTGIDVDKGRGIHVTCPK